ncbi:hypothetical protein [Bradyrhizobium sp.]|nr:hypothetical protein [Bradyrhizobium sp.]MBV8696752.1 hypothetical protein [Bradyrhizobium sp.]MBV8921614.1 hypothetical protein [Bradyrhizobium sp.]MBV9979760.1 hypothetical protein [Bradyrhizobium sp.]
MSHEPNCFDGIVGEKLSAITFVLNYWQLQFDGSTINALTRMEVISNRKALRDGEDQFRNLICEQIGKIVVDVTPAKSEAFVIAFEDGSSISISLRAEDYVGPEALVFYGSDRTIVIRDDDVSVFGQGLIPPS